MIIVSRARQIIFVVAAVSFLEELCSRRHENRKKTVGLPAGKYVVGEYMSIVLSSLKKGASRRRETTTLEWQCSPSNKDSQSSLLFVVVSAVNC